MVVVVDNQLLISAIGQQPPMTTAVGYDFSRLHSSFDYSDGEVVLLVVATISYCDLLLLTSTSYY